MRNIDDVRKDIEELLMEEFGIRPDVRVFAFGGGAGRIASYITKKRIEGTKVIAINTDERGLEDVNADKKMLLGKDVMGEHKDTNGEVKVGEYIINRNRAWILEEAANADVIVLIAALGGGTGTGGILEAARILKERLNKPIIAITLLPFKVEKERRDKAETVLQELRDKVTKLVVLDNELLLKHRRLTVLKAYETLYDEISNFVAKIANITRREIEKKFREIYLKDIDSVVEEAYSSVMIAA